jgi:hypothetical protein
VRLKTENLDSRIKEAKKTKLRGILIMKKLLTIAFVLTMVFAFATTAVAEGKLYTVADGFYYESEKAGYLVVADNHNDYEFDIVVGVNFLGLQEDFTGQLRFVSFEAEHECVFVKTFVGAEVDVTIINAQGSTNPYTFVITEEYEWRCECGEVKKTKFKDITTTIDLPNNYKGNVEVGEYIVYVNSQGNTKVNDVYIVW